MPGPLRIIVTDPIYQILKLASVELGVQNLLDLELGKTVHVEGGGDLLDSAWEFVCHMWLQKADVEYRMDVHGRRKIEAE